MEQSFHGHRLSAFKIELVYAVVVAMIPMVSRAQTSGTWTNASGGTWTNTANWSGGAIASGTGALANFSTLNITGTQTVTLDTATALGSLVFGDTATSSTGSWVITSGTTLTLAAGSGTTPRITVSGMGGGSVILSTWLLGTSGFILNDTNTPNPGTLVLSSSNGFTGGVTVMGGSLGLGAANAVPTANSVVLDGGALLRSSTLAGTFTNPISIGAIGGEIRNGVSGQWTVNGAVTGTGSLVLNTIGAGNIVFGNTSSTYTGGTRILDGSAVAVSQDAAFGSGTISFEGGTMRPTSGADRTLANPLAFAGNFGFDVAARALTFNGPATIQGATRTLTVTGTVALATFNGSIGDGGNALGFTKAGVGTLVLGGSNTYSGTTTLSAGTLRLGNQQALQNSTLSHSGTGSLLFDSGVATNAFTFGGLSASSTAATLALANTAGTAITLTVGGNNASTAYAGSLTGAGSLVKTGAGTLTLSGSNTYGGTTTVSGGTLLVNGNHSAAAGALTVDALATLGGSGTIGGAITVNGILSPGNSPGVLSIASLALGGSSTSLFEINGTSRGAQYDGVDISSFGGPTYGGMLSLVFGNGSAFADNTIFNLFSFNGGPSGAFSTVASSGFYTGTWTNNNDGTFKLEQGGQTLTFSQSTGDIVVVPEPAALALAGIGAGLVGWKLIRRRRRSA
jgi:autotransporter-associated beta strand protein